MEERKRTAFGCFTVFSLACSSFCHREEAGVVALACELLCVEVQGTANGNSGFEGNSVEDVWCGGERDGCAWRWRHKLFDQLATAQKACEHLVLDSTPSEQPLEQNSCSGSSVICRRSCSLDCRCRWTSGRTNDLLCTREAELAKRWTCGRETKGHCHACRTCGRSCKRRVLCVGRATNMLCHAHGLLLGGFAARLLTACALSSTANASANRSPLLWNQRCCVSLCHRCIRSCRRSRWTRECHCACKRQFWLCKRRRPRWTRSFAVQRSKGARRGISKFRDNVCPLRLC